MDRTIPTGRTNPANWPAGSCRRCARTSSSSPPDRRDRPPAVDNLDRLGIDRTADSPTRRCDRAGVPADGVTAHPTGAWLSSPRHGPPMTTSPADDEQGGHRPTARPTRAACSTSISTSREVCGASGTHRSSSTCAGPGGSLCRRGRHHPAGYPRLLGHPDPCPATHGLRLHAELPQTLLSLVPQQRGRMLLATPRPRRSDDAVGR